VNPAVLRTPAGVPFFKFNRTVLADGQRARFSPEVAYFVAGFGMSAQYFHMEQKLRPGTGDLVRVPFDGFYVQMTYLLTGEERTGYSQQVAPRRPFDPVCGCHGWGAWELVARVSRVQAGDVVFAPGPLRVQAVHADLGAPPRPGEPLLDATSTTHVVDLSVPVDLAYLVHPHDPVTVTLPDGKAQTPGTVSAISPVAVQPTDSADPGRPGTPTIDVTVALADPAAAAAYTTAPITVAVTTAAARGVLAVPVSALLAHPDGSFAVTVVDGTARREVAVTTGLFAQALVEVSGPGIAEGTLVEVPAS
jgi:hypothetical protein